MYDDQYQSIDKVHLCSKSDIWHQGKKWLEKSILSLQAQQAKKNPSITCFTTKFG
jgi:hypothetical protein